MSVRLFFCVWGGVGCAVAAAATAATAGGGCEDCCCWGVNGWGVNVDRTDWENEIVSMLFPERLDKFIHTLMFLGSMTLGEPCSAVPRTVGAVGVRRMVLTWGGARRACRG